MPQISYTQCEEIQRVFTEEEITTTMFSIADSKAPGPDGVNVKFFKLKWNVVDPDIIKGILRFFVFGFLT